MAARIERPFPTCPAMCEFGLNPESFKTLSVVSKNGIISKCRDYESSTHKGLVFRRISEEFARDKHPINVTWQAYSRSALSSIRKH